jgi:polysaccharide pyruvyl transferase WcaK-like protein
MVRSLPSFIQKLLTYDVFVCMGADVIDGHYSEKDSLIRLYLADCASRLGLKTIITGFSFNENAAETIVRKLDSLHKGIEVYCRDQVSLERLQGKLNKRRVTLVADVAFLLKPDEASFASAEIIEWINLRKAENKKVIGFNLSSHALVKIQNPKDQQLLVDKLSDSLEKLYDECGGQVCFVGLPHDIRDLPEGPSDVELVKTVINSLPQNIQADTKIISEPFKGADVKAICQYLDLVVTGRMHLAIAAMGQLTPAFCLTYQGKFEGLFKHFSMSPLTLAPSEAIEGEKLYYEISNILPQLQQLSQHIERKLPEVKEMSKRNFHAISFRHELG